MRESRWPPSFLVLKFMSRKPTGVTSGAFFCVCVVWSVCHRPLRPKSPLYLVLNRECRIALVGVPGMSRSHPSPSQGMNSISPRISSPIEENNLPTFNPSISLPSYLFFWPDCQRLPQCRSQYADLLLYLILTPYAASLNSLLREMYS